MKYKLRIISSFFLLFFYSISVSAQCDERFSNEIIIDNAWEFLTELQAEKNIRGNTKSIFSLDKILETKTGFFLNFQLAYNNIPVEGQRISLMYNQYGKIFSINDKLTVRKRVVKFESNEDELAEAIELLSTSKRDNPNLDLVMKEGKNGSYLTYFKKQNPSGDYVYASINSKNLEHFFSIKNRAKSQTSDKISNFSVSSMTNCNEPGDWVVNYFFPDPTASSDPENIYYRYIANTKIDGLTYLYHNNHTADYVDNIDNAYISDSGKFCYDPEDNEFDLKEYCEAMNYYILHRYLRDEANWNVKEFEYSSSGELIEGGSHLGDIMNEGVDFTYQVDFGLNTNISANGVTYLPDNNSLKFGWESNYQPFAADMFWSIHGVSKSIMGKIDFDKADNLEDKQNGIIIGCWDFLSQSYLFDKYNKSDHNCFTYGGVGSSNNNFRRTDYALTPLDNDNKINSQNWSTTLMELREVLGGNEARKKMDDLVYNFFLATIDDPSYEYASAILFSVASNHPDFTDSDRCKIFDYLNLKFPVDDNDPNNISFISSLELLDLIHTSNEYEVPTGRDFYIKDNLEDIGVEPNEAGDLDVFESPDIWNSQSINGTIHESPNSNLTINYLNVRVRDRGCQVLEEGELVVYMTAGPIQHFCPQYLYHYDAANSGYKFGIDRHGNNLPDCTPDQTSLSAIAGKEIGRLSLVSGNYVEEVIDGEPVRRYKIPYIPFDPDDFDICNDDQMVVAWLAEIQSPDDPHFHPYDNQNANFDAVYQYEKKNNNVAVRIDDQIMVGNIAPPYDHEYHLLVQAPPVVESGSGNSGNDEHILELGFNLKSVDGNTDADMSDYVNTGYIKLRLSSELLSLWQQGGSQGDGYSFDQNGYVTILDESFSLANIRIPAGEMERSKIAFQFNGDESRVDFSILFKNDVGCIVGASNYSVQPVLSARSTLQTQDQEFTIQPNPATDNIIIKNTELEGILDIHIMDINGKIYHSEREDLQQQEKEIDISSMMPGVYFLRLQDREGKMKTKRFVKIH